MAVTTVPNVASTFSAGSVILANTNDRWISLGFATTPGGSGCAMFMTGSLLSTACNLLPVICATNTTYQSPMFNSPCNTIIVASVSGGSAIVWIRSGCHA